MAAVTILSVAKYNMALSGGKCDPPGLIHSYYALDKLKYAKARGDRKGLDLNQLKKRLPPGMYKDIRGAVGLCLRHSQTIFPSYLFLLPEFLNEEWLASVDWHKGFHRDHVLHQPMCVYVGYELLRQPWALGQKKVNLLENCIDAFLESSHCQYLRDHISELGGQRMFNRLAKLSRKTFGAYFKDIFFLAAMFHDIGYPWQFANNLGNPLCSLSLGGNSLSMDPEVISRNYGDRLFMAPFKGYQLKAAAAPSTWQDSLNEMVRQSVTVTHGLPGAINFLHLNDMLRKYPDHTKPMHRFGMEWAAMAIMMHDMAKLYGRVENGMLKVINPQLRVSFNRDPLSFLLTLTDLIQDFGRPDSRFKTHDNNKNIVTVRYRHRCERVELKWDDNKKNLTILYKYKNKGDYLNNLLKFQPENEILYFDPEKGYLDYSWLGIERIKLAAAMYP
ncbi:hypothetical protein SDC9_14468 [bioreactor metagenome]|uniref:HD domain-containing protein n=1 Tax=bioreactor metagenome TaxID=1076179 RepID=A0A644TP65_9ZZZZ|nr:hypothetical protein [Desulfovibrio desulfuricans]MEA4991754.1 hypothetical protein [Desulfovibrio desulfuricans]